MKQGFITKGFRPDTLAIIDQANDIIEEYQAQGFTLTLRQLYYQFVARDLIPNKLRSYKNLGDKISDGRLAGLIDWEAIEDRTRNLKTNLRLDSPADAVRVVREQYGIDMWSNQPRRIEVWIEKEALVGIVEGVCSEFDVPYFGCRGYVSQSEQWRAYRRHADHQPTLILHLGDHDPSGLDMTRDNRDRLTLFHGCDHTEIRRIALNIDQVQQYAPPPNPAKTTDARYREYRRRFGDDSWELDALEPSVLVNLIRTEIEAEIDFDAMDQRRAQLTVDLARIDSIIEQIKGEAV